MIKTELQVKYKSPLFQMTQTTPTCLWNDSASVEELTYSIEHGTVGATCNPSIAVSVRKKELPVWKSRIQAPSPASPNYPAMRPLCDLCGQRERGPSVLSRIPAGRWGMPSDLAGAAVFLASQASNYVLGHLLVVDGGWLYR